MVLADTAFGTNEFVTTVRCLKYHALVGVPCNRKLSDGRRFTQLYKRGQQVRLLGLKFSVHLSWYYLKRQDGKERKTLYPLHQSSQRQHYDLVSQRVAGVPPVVATGEPEGWGRRRWQIEGFFKVAKYRFGLARFGQQTLLGVYRWLVLSLTAYLLAHWIYLYSPTGSLPDWGEAARAALELLLPLMALLPLLAEIQHLKPLAKSHGIDINMTWCKI